MDNNKIPKNRRKTLRHLGIALIVIGILIIAYPSYTNFIMKQKETDVLSAWNNQLNLGSTPESNAQETSSSNNTQLTGQPGNTIQTQTTESQNAQSQPTKNALFKIEIPKINSNWIVYEGTDTSTLKNGPGHYTGTGMPGENGVCLIAGHRTTYGAPFNRVDQLLNGDQIILETKDNKKFVYLVTNKLEVLPNDVSAIKQTNYSSLILSTCTPKFYATRRLLIFAKLSN
jgi:sortase A